MIAINRSTPHSIVVTDERKEQYDIPLEFLLLLRSAITQGQVVMAVKATRSIYPMGLAEAKHLCNWIEWCEKGKIGFASTAAADNIWNT